MEALRLIDATVLLLCASIYLGTGVTLAFFLFPIAPLLTPDTYRAPFVNPVAAATKFFTYMTIVMLVGSIALVVIDWGEDGRWLFGAGYLLLTIAATVLTMVGIFPYNKRMAAGITDAGELQDVLAKWRRVNTLRASIWAVQWAVITAWWIVYAA
jgi:uncharacterized membrane protein